MGYRIKGQTFILRQCHRADCHKDCNVSSTDYLTYAIYEYISNALYMEAVVTDGVCVGVRER